MSSDSSRIQPEPRYHKVVSSRVNRHQAVFENRANVPWPDIEKMLKHYGAVAAMRRFLVEAGIEEGGKREV
jgi:hypothetical protein